MRARNWIGLASAVGTAALASDALRRYRHELKDRTDQLESRRRVAGTRVGDIEYAREGEGPTALVIHGAGGGFDQGLFLGSEMLGEGFDLIAPSRFGYLGTPSPNDVSAAAQADAHAALLDYLGIDKAIVLGVSAGAPSAIEFAVRHPGRIRALLLVVPRAFDPEYRVGAEPTLPNRAVLGMFERAADLPYWVSAHVARQPLVRFFGVDPEFEAKAPSAERDKVTAIIRDMLPVSARVEGIRNDTTSGVPESRLDEVTAPTLIISTEDDLYHTLPGAKYTADHIADAELRVFPTGGHLLVSREAETRTAIADFLYAKLGLPPSPQTGSDQQVLRQ